MWCWEKRGPAQSRQRPPYLTPLTAPTALPPSAPAGVSGTRAQAGDSDRISAAEVTRSSLEGSRDRAGDTDQLGRRRDPGPRRRGNAPTAAGGSRRSRAGGGGDNGNGPSLLLGMGMGPCAGEEGEARGTWSWGALGHNSHSQRPAQGHQGAQGTRTPSYTGVCTPEHGPWPGKGLGING